MMRMFVVVVMLMVAVHSASAAPPHRKPLPKIKFPITTIVNAKLQQILGNINDPAHLKNPVEIRVDQDYVAHVYIKMDNCQLSGVTSFTAHNCFVDAPIPFPGEGQASISISIKSPKVTLNSNHYFINGTMVDHIELFGEGPGMISVDDMDIKVEGTAYVIMEPFSAVFSEAALDLEMWRWTVNLEDLMPGTDLGTVFNEFFSMYGPEIFDVIERSINNSGILLDFLNTLFPPHTSQ